MTGQDLKNSILQLAIQGKLVPQDANDEPASVLLERIKAEKKKLIEEKKIKKEKPLAEITEDEMPFEIPESWEWVRLGEICSYVVDCPHSTPIKSQNPTNHPCIRTSEIKGGNIIWDSMQYLDDVNYKLRIARLKPIPGDIVYAREGVYGDAVILPSGFDFCLGQRTMLMRMALPEIINYIHKAIISPFVYGQAKALNREGTTSVGHVNMSDIVTFLIPLPPLSEQRRIVAKIEELMPLIDEYDKAQKELDALNSAMPEQLKQSLLQEAIMGKLGTNNPDDEPASELLKRIREEKAQLIKEKKIKKEKPLPEITEDEMPFEIPENWEWVRLGEVANIINGFTPLRSNPDFWNNGDVSWFTVEDIHQQGRRIHQTLQKINKKALSKDSNRILPKGSILLCCTASVGEYAIAEIELTTNQQFNGIFIKPQYCSILYNEFLFSIAPTFKDRLLALAGKTTFNFVSVKKVENIPIPLPPLAEQHRIVEKLDALLPMISELAKSK